MTDEPKVESAREFAGRILKGMGFDLKLIGDSPFHVAQDITARDAALVAQAQAEAFERAQEECESVLQSRKEDDVNGIAAANLCGMGIHALSPDPRYRERIEAQARLEERKRIHANIVADQATGAADYSEAEAYADRMVGPIEA